MWLSQDPFLVISKITESGVIVPICKTEVLKNDHNPKWKQVFLSIQQVGSKVQKIGARIMHHYDITSQSRQIIFFQRKKIGVINGVQHTHLKGNEPSTSPTSPHLDTTQAER